MTEESTEHDFENLFAIAKAHGVSFEQVRELAQAEFSKALGDCTPEELEMLAYGIHTRWGAE